MTHLDFLTCLITIIPMKTRATARKRPKIIASTVAAMLSICAGAAVVTTVGHVSPSAQHRYCNERIRTLHTRTTLSRYIELFTQPLLCKIGSDQCRACVVCWAYRLAVVCGASTMKHVT